MPVGLSLSLNGYKRFITQLRDDLRAQSTGWVLVNTPNGLNLHIDRSDQYIKKFSGAFAYDLTQNHKRDETHYNNMGGKENTVSGQSLNDAVAALERGGNYSTFGPHLRQVCLLVSEAARSQIIYRCVQKLLHGHKGTSGEGVKVSDFDGLSLNYSSTKDANFLNGFQTLEYQHYDRNRSNPKVAKALKDLPLKLGGDVLG